METKALLTNPIMTFDREQLHGDLALCERQGLDQMFLRHRTVFFADGCRYAHDIAQKRWGIRFTFYETGTTPIKRVFQSHTLNTDAAELWLGNMRKDPRYGEMIVRELRDIVLLQKRLLRTVPEISPTPRGIRKALLAHHAYFGRFLGLGFLWFAADPMKQSIDTDIRKQWRGSTEALEPFLEAVYRPMKLPLSSKEQRELLRITRLHGQERQEALEKHWRRYRCLSLHHINDELFPLDYYVSRLRTFDDPATYHQQRASLASADQEIRQANELLASAPLPETIKQHIAFIRWFMYLRTESVDHMMLVNGTYKPLFESIAKHFRISVDMATGMTYKELVDSLEVATLAVGKDILRERTEQGYAYFTGPEHAVLVTGSAIGELEQACGAERRETTITSLKGQSAFGGLVRGIARVISDRRRADELQPGEILVTVMTAPDFVPAMKRAAGIITNEGGILCHAAIMSRELRKPCIIGTKIATDAIRTGQMVTLDADTGTVTIG